MRISPQKDEELFEKDEEKIKISLHLFFISFDALFLYIYRNYLSLYKLILSFSIRKSAGLIVNLQNQIKEIRLWKQKKKYWQQ